MPNFSRECYEDWVNEIMDNCSDDRNKSSVKRENHLKGVLQKYKEGNDSDE